MRSRSIHIFRRAKANQGTPALIIVASATIKRPPEYIYRLISDMKYVLEAIAPDVESVVKSSEGPIGVGSTWTETLKAPSILQTVSP
jgi:hypothetical protein